MDTCPGLPVLPGDLDSGLCERVSFPQPPPPGSPGLSVPRYPSFTGLRPWCLPTLPAPALPPGGEEQGLAQLLSLCREVREVPFRVWWPLLLAWRGHAGCRHERWPRPGPAPGARRVPVLGAGWGHAARSRSVASQAWPLRRLLPLLPAPGDFGLPAGLGAAGEAGSGRRGAQGRTAGLHRPGPVGADG